ncbi:MAG: peptidoglycan-binding protein [Clostridia bacterium]|nr:peptidoglycan-binding protein [Clostridia bacterium]
MAYENLCMYCFQELGGRSTCPHCGRDSHAAVPQIQMLPGTLVYHDRFLVGRALGQDATGIVYTAFDTKRENKLRIREYLPRDCAERLNDGTVVPIAGMEDKFDNGIRRLRASVEETDDPRRRHFFFEENGTAYIVQRKNPQAEAERGSGDRHEDEDEGGGKKRALIIALVAAIVVVGAAAALIFMFNGALNGPKDLTETPTLDPNQVWIPSESPTVTPYASPTFAALVDPDLSWMDFTFDDASEGSGKTSQSTAGGASKTTAVPTLTGDSSDYKNVNAKSGSTEIKKVQQRLVALGWMSKSKISGKYDKTTKNAVLAFQKYINSHFSPSEKLKEDGIAGPKTQQWLYQVDAVKPTATPKPQVTAGSDEDAVDADSSAKKIRAMQRELILLGVLPEGADNGKYDATTQSAVKRFQTRVNQLQGYDVLEVTGRMDALSMAFLDHYVDEWREIQTATAEPTAAPTANPTAVPKQYDPDSDPNPIRAGSSAEAVRSVQRRLIAIGMLPEGADDGVYGASTTLAVKTFQQWVNQQRNEQTLPMNGEADALTRAYLKYCQDNGLRPAAEVTRVPGEDENVNENEDITINKDSHPDSIRRVQKLLSDVGLMDAKGIDGVYGGATTRAVLAFQKYINAHGGNLPVTGVVDDLTRRELEYYSDHDMLADGSADATAAPTEAPAADAFSFSDIGNTVEGQRSADELEYDGEKSSTLGGNQEE